MSLAVCDATKEVHPLRPEKGELLQPRFTIGPRDRHVVQPYPARHQAPLRRSPAAVAVGLGDLGQCQVVMSHVALCVEPAVEAHLRSLASGYRLELGDTAKAHDVGPELVR